MLGKIKNYDKKNEIGYIEGYDETIYFYHQINVKNREELKEGDIVSFDYLLEKNVDELPYAINIVKETFEKKSKPYRELYEILKHLPLEERDKIPSNFLKEIEEKMDTNYVYTVNHLEDFENQEMLEETRVLLAIVYRDYLASEEEKIKILEKEKEELKQEEKEKLEKYNPDNIFKSKNVEDNKQSESQIDSETALVKIKPEKWYRSLIAFFKRIFKK